MYKRIKRWIQALNPNTHSENGWVNEFTTEEVDVIDIRFKLYGYGWKPNVDDENLSTLEKGSYKISYRINGTSDWTFLARVDSSRAGTDEVTVYKHVGITTGLLQAEKYDIKIEADKGSKFTAWGGSLEGITSGGQFWYDLEVRALAYKILNNYDELAVTENAEMQLV